MDQDRVVLNVGGSFYTTTRGTLTARPSMLADMFAPTNRALLKHDADGSVFLDADGALFGHVLNALRHNISVRGDQPPPGAWPDAWAALLTHMHLDDEADDDDDVTTEPAGDVAARDETCDVRRCIVVRLLIAWLDTMPRTGPAQTSVTALHFIEGRPFHEREADVDDAASRVLLANLRALGSRPNEWMSALCAKGPLNDVIMWQMGARCEITSCRVPTPHVLPPARHMQLSRSEREVRDINDAVFVDVIHVMIFHYS